MISDAEQRRLAEIETVLRREDPDFVRHFDKRSPTPRRRYVVALLAVLVVLAATAIAWVLGGVGIGVIVLTVVGNIAIALGLSRCRAQPPEKSE